MIRRPRAIGMAKFLAAAVMPWRPALRVRAKESKLTFYAHWRDVIGRHIAKYGEHEPQLTRFIAGYLAAARSPGLFVDVGANIGWHTVHAAQYPTVEAVVAFEPDAFNAWLLDRNLTANNIGKAVVNACAVGAARGIAQLHRYRSTNYGRHSLLTDYGHGSRQVPVTDLDSALDALGLGDKPVLVLKIDVEGYEPAVIAGAARTLARTQVVLLEYSPGLSGAGGLSTDAMAELMVASGFAPHRLAADGKLMPASLADLRSVQGQTDLIWTRQGALADRA